MRIGLAQDVEFFLRDCAGNADRKSGTGERMAADEGFRQAELAAQRAHFVLEEFAQGLDQFHVHAFGQAADIVVALDRDARPAGEGDALDHVRIQRALREKFRRALSVRGDLSLLLPRTHR